MEVTKISSAVVEKANNFNLSMNKDDTELLLEVVPEELTDEELVELEQECIAKEEAREKETAEGKKRRIPKKICSKQVSRSFCRPQQAP